jgi:hypothetical protein
MTHDSNKPVEMLRYPLLSPEEVVTLRRIEYVADAPCLPNPGNAHQRDLRDIAAVVRRLSSTPTAADRNAVLEDFSRLTLRANLEHILRESRDANPSTVVDRLMAAIPRRASTPAADRNAVLAGVVVELFGGEAEKALELLAVVRDAGGRVDAEDDKLEPFCDDMAGGDDTINLCFDAGYLQQWQIDDDLFEVRLTEKGAAALASTPPTAPADMRGLAGEASDALREAVWAVINSSDGLEPESAGERCERELRRHGYALSRTGGAE